MKVLPIMLIFGLCALAPATPSIAEERPLYVTVGETGRAPIGWIEFCKEYDPICKTTPSSPRDVVLSADAWKDMQRVNQWVNTNVKHMSDIDHWGVVERWHYPDDGYGGCEDFVLQKQRMLIKAGWPREALLITIVRDQNGDGHSLLTVKTNIGEYILDDITDHIVLWSDSDYRFVKRQSQSDPNVWVSLGDTRSLPGAVGSH